MTINQLWCLGFLFIALEFAVGYVIKTPLIWQAKYDRRQHILSAQKSLSWSKSDLAQAANLDIRSFGMPRVLPPAGEQDSWMLWLQVRDASIAENVINISSGRILLATSTDGIKDWNLHPDSPVLMPSKENGDWFYFDSEHVGLGDIIQPGMEAQKILLTSGNIYIMYTYGGSGDSSVIPREGKDDLKVVGSKMEIGVAVSQDGAHWSRVEGPSPYGSVVEAGKDERDFDSMFVGWPSVVEVGKEYRMYYHTFDRSTKKFTIAQAIATDGLLRWIKQGIVLQGSDEEGAFDYNGVTRRHVVRLTDGSFKMFYEGISKSNEHSIGVATSSDGKLWMKKGQVFRKNEENSETWDAGGVGSPHLVWMPELQRWRLYYMGYSKSTSGTSEGGRESDCGMGVAMSIDAEGTEFVRIDI